ncbi:MAG TPA: kinase [Candidatus Omnitrophica bacterium]|nr:MAG: kinase [Omnitrophica WOR_2 bacterium GWA2_45_18]OGX18763.1 MAG: kinase [Omnitrophica WOR_2 bacterium GWC2_45_7]HBR14335.1 kinase [Candidatus Omnitrophota bacterium]
MIISRTPFRISFFGGGTDYPVWYEANEGAVLSTTIDKYCYLTCRYLPPFFEYKHRIVYSKVELAKDNNTIVHPAVRACLDYMKIQKGIELHHDGDLPARTGLGSSSSFTVGLLHSLYALKGSMITKSQLAKESIHIERDILKEHVGSQDQIAAAFGGFNKISFKKDGGFFVEPIIISKERLLDLEKHIMLYFTGFSRIASEIALQQIKNTPHKTHELRQMYQMVDAALNILSGNHDLKDFGKLLEESWQLKRSLTTKISSVDIDQIYEAALQAGATGGKLLGAGGGGFIIFFVKPEFQEKVRQKFKNMLEVKFQFENSGSQIIFYNET